MSRRRIHGKPPRPAYVGVIRRTTFSKLLPVFALSLFARSLLAAEDQGGGLLCRPEGEGPFPAVIYSHGRIASPQTLARAKDGGWKRTCERLAADGFLAFIAVREFASDRRPPQIPANKNALSKAIDYVKSLPEVDRSRMALMGHSRGGLLALMTGLDRKDIKALILTAPANIPPYFSKAVARVSSLDVPVLLMVEVSDEMGSLDAVNLLDEALRKREKDVRTIRYDRGGGHFLFVGSGDLSWWDDVQSFLREKLNR